MFVIAESGSTKTDWCIFNPKNGTSIFKKTTGINPYFSNKEHIITSLGDAMGEIDIKTINKVFFYGPGCSQIEQKEKLMNWLKCFFTHAVIEVETDLLAAGRGAFQNDAGIVCILGTGSNSGVYKNGLITESLPSLGYIFGDEGSGSQIGKQLIYDFLNDELPPVVKDLFNETYNIGYKEILNNVYSGSFPNRFLASFTQFVLDNIALTYCRTLVDNALDSFFTKRLTKYDDFGKCPIKFVGSVACSFSNVLAKVALRYDIKLNTENDIMKTPLEGLVKYHLRQFTMDK